MTAYDFDVLTVTDFRHSGGTTASIAQEIEVQARMGLRTGLIQIDAPYMRRGKWAARIRGLIVGGFAELVGADQPVRAHLMVLRHPRVFEHAGWSIAARADHTVMVANQVYQDGTRERPYYDLAAIERRLREQLGVEPVWAPIGPMMRDSLARAAQPVPAMTDSDWCNVIDVDSWQPRHRSAHTGAVRVGRHSRDNFKKWPETRADLLASYPDSEGYEVRVLGGAKAAKRVIRRLPGNWRVFPFDSVRPQQFLADLDVYVYHHHSGWQEAFGRAVLEALAAGLPVITHGYFQRLFGDTCIYCEPKEVPARLAELGKNPALNQAGIDFVRQHYDWDAHARRIGPFVQRADAGVTSRPSARTRVLFISSNGGGLGHLTRLLAIARRLPPEFEPVFLTMSSGIDAVRALGYWVDYLPGPTSGELRNNEWLDYVNERVSAAVRVLSPAAVVFDGTFVYRGLRDALGALPQVFKVWSRRAMWKPLSVRRAMQAEAHVPGEFAGDVDDGFTRTQDQLTTTLAPVVLLGPDELLARADARAELGIEDDAVAVLLNLGAGNINRIDNVVTAVAEILRENPKTHLVAAQSIISSAQLPDAPGRITMIETYPLSRVMRAFDCCVIAPGYNSYHELLSYAIPTLFIPNEQTALDDQVKRATWGARAGTNLVSGAEDLPTLRDALHRLLDSEVRASLAQRCRQLAPADGAAQAAALIARGCVARHTGTETPGTPAPPFVRRAITAVGKALRRGRPRSAKPERTLFVLERQITATQSGRDAIETIAGLGKAAVCMVGAGDFQAIRRLGLNVELITEDLDSDELSDLELAMYAIDKARALIEAYNCRAVRVVGETGLGKQIAALGWLATPEPFEP